ncbi:MAG TPA: conjugal transfer protein TraR [Ignavibacteriaceae bacterium]|jgi:RNA polymerase-binding transcription factor DksA|nr:conjugal transfer protein TraR [Ignavibacteriaceae bacterium]
MARKATTKKASTKKTVKVKDVKKAKPAKKEVKKSTPAKPKKTVVKKTVEKKPAVKKAAVKEKKAEKTTSKPAKTAKKEKKEVKTHKTAEKVVHHHTVEEKKISPKIKGYSKKELEHFREIILNKKNEIIEQLQNLRDQMLDPTTGEYINENSPYSLHMAEQGTDAMEREKTFLYAQRENKFLGYLEDALKRIDAGTYGICIECIDEPQMLCDTCPLIPKARLEAVPHSQLCLPIKMRQEKTRRF